MRYFGFSCFSLQQRHRRRWVLVNVAFFGNCSWLFINCFVRKMSDCSSDFGISIVSCSCWPLEVKTRSSRSSDKRFICKHTLAICVKSMLRPASGRQRRSLLIIALGASMLNLQDVAWLRNLILHCLSYDRKWAQRSEVKFNSQNSP